MNPYHLTITEKASEEYSDAFWFYEHSRQGLGDPFEKETERLFIQLRKNPFLFPRRFKHFREAQFARFPFFIVYEISEKNIIIHSVFHTSRNPKKKIKHSRN